MRFASLDSTVAVCWIKSKDGKWKVFLSNLVAKIRLIPLTWLHCPNIQNPEDIETRGATERVYLVDKTNMVV